MKHQDAILRSHTAAATDHVAGRDDPQATLPLLPASTQQKDAEACLHLIRRFFHGDPGASDELEPPGEAFLPALLSAFRDPKRIRHEYPLFLFPPGQLEQDCPCQPLREVLGRLAAGFAPGQDDARILKDNFARLERAVREALTTSTPIMDARECLAKAAKQIDKELSLGDGNAQRFREDLGKLFAAVPSGSQILALNEQTPIHLFILAVRHRAAGRRRALREQVADLGARLRDLLRLDDLKHPQKPRLVEAAGAEGEAHFDAEVMARVMTGMRGAPPLDPPSRARIESIIKVFEDWMGGDNAPLAIIVHDDDPPNMPTTDEIEFRTAGKPGLCAAAAACFDEHAARYGRLFGALRAASLTLKWAYEPARHDPLLLRFDWTRFSTEQMQCLPAIVAASPADYLAAKEMVELSRLLLSGRVVHVIAAVRPASNPGGPGEPDVLLGYRFELAYLGLSHRESLVDQSTAARPKHLVNGFLQSLDAAGASLHVVDSGLYSDQQVPRFDTFLHSGAAVEGRAHPLFHYNPGAGVTWASRFDASQNPQPQLDWPVYDFSYRTTEGQHESMSLAFTFADFALVEPVFRADFRAVPDVCDNEELIPIADYLGLSQDDASDRIAYVWAVDGQDRLHRLVISDRLVFACRDRLRYWRTLQELAGIRNEHVREAVERERQRLSANFEAERRTLAESHAAEIQRVGTAAAAEAMQRLAQTLVETDSGVLTAATSQPPPTPVSGVADTPVPEETAPANKQEEQAAEIAEPQDDGPQEPWIDSALCTSCNDCLGINPKLFVYNANKQAMIGDPSAGTYAQLVQAAEKCSPRCIHPGTPMDPSEPGLDELIERGKRFN